MAAAFRTSQQAAKTLPPAHRTGLLPVSLLSGLSAQDMVHTKAARPWLRIVSAGDVLYFQGDESHSVYFLHEGWAFRYQGLEDGRRQILDFALPGAVLGLPGSGTHSDGVETLTCCTFSVLSRDSLFNLIQRVPTLGTRLLEALAHTQMRAYEHLTTVGRRSARERVANLLFELLLRAKQLGAAGGMAQMTIPLMQPHIADALGLASETVCRTLSALRKDGILQLHTRELNVLDRKRLASEAGSIDGVTWHEIGTWPPATPALRKPGPARGSAVAVTNACF